MGDHSSEKYLDQLLNSMHGEETEHPKEQQAAKQVLRDDFEKQLFGEEETKEKAKAKNEEDFLSLRKNCSRKIFRSIPRA